MHVILYPNVFVLFELMKYWTSNDSIDKESLLPATLFGLLNILPGPSVPIHYYLTGSSSSPNVVSDLPGLPSAWT